MAYKKQYNRNGYRKSKNYNNSAPYTYVDDKLFVGTPQHRKRVRWFTSVSIILLSVLLVGLTAYFTNGFYSNNVQVWDMAYAWYCPQDNNVYADNYNALITRNNYALKQSNDKLKIYIDLSKLDKIEPAERSYIRFNVVYYSGEKAVGQSGSYVLPADTLGLLDEKKELIWSYSDYIHDSSFQSLEVDSVKVSVLYDYEGKNISFIQKSLYSSMIIIEYK